SFKGYTTGSTSTTSSSLHKTNKQSVAQVNILGHNATYQNTRTSAQSNEIC
ncbi:7627_t:CDS:1, partial [Racocetra persica]